MNVWDIPRQENVKLMILFGNHVKIFLQLIKNIFKFINIVIL